MCETSLAEASKSLTTAPENSLDGVDHTFAGEPQEEGMMQRSSSFFLIKKPRSSNPVGLREGLARCQRRRLR